MSADPSTEVEADFDGKVVDSLFQLTEAVDLINRKINALAMRVARLEGPVSYAETPGWGGTEDHGA